MPAGDGGNDQVAHGPLRAPGQHRGRVGGDPHTGRARIGQGEAGWVRRTCWHLLMVSVGTMPVLTQPSSASCRPMSGGHPREKGFTARSALIRTSSSRRAGTTRSESGTRRRARRGRPPRPTCAIGTHDRAADLRRAGGGLRSSSRTSSLSHTGCATRSARRDDPHPIVRRPPGSALRAARRK